MATIRKQVWVVAVLVLALAATGCNDDDIGFSGATTGEYLIGPGHIASGTVTSLAGDGWSANSTQGSGVINVTVLTATRVAGTFSFTAPAVAAGIAPATRVVTAGSFDVEF